MNKFENIAEKYPGAGTLVKGIQILEYLYEAEKPCTSAELLSQTKLPKATLYRLLNALIEFGYVLHDERLKTYSLGHRLVELGSNSLANIDLRSAAADELTRLSEDINETISLAKLEKDRSICVDVRRSSNRLGIGVEIGSGLPAVVSAAGRAILAGMPPNLTNRFLSGLSQEERAELDAEFAISRARGYTIAPSATLDGVLIIAAPIIGGPDMGNGAILVTALADRISLERRHIIGRDLMEASRRIMGLIGSAPLSIMPNPRPAEPVEKDLRCVAPVGAVVGEGPVWDKREGLLRWADLAAPALHAFDPKTGRDAAHPVPYLVSAILPAENNKLVAITQNGAESYNAETQSFRTLHNPEAHISTNRFNDAKTDSKGRIWAGTMSLDASMPSGSLYCFDDATSARAVDGGLQVANGLGWSPDEKRFYFVDSAVGNVFVYDFDSEAGIATNREVFLNFKPHEGKPDGLCVDSAGNIWVALWDAWCVNYYNPQGQLLRKINMPVPRPTSLCFGGDDLKTLYITSASIRLPADVLEEAPLSGGLFAIDVDIAGQPIHEVRAWQ